jgi:hypothetical protein
MACMIQFAPAMATTQVARVTSCENTMNRREIPFITERGPLRMNWVAVTDGDGNRVLRMQWEPSADDRSRFAVRCPRNTHLIILA